MGGDYGAGERDVGEVLPIGMIIRIGQVRDSREWIPTLNG
jgi:hypothetical protein